MKNSIILTAAFTMVTSSGFAQVTTKAGAADARAATSPAISDAQRVRTQQAVRDLQREIVTAPVTPAESVAKPAADASPNAAPAAAATTVRKRPNFNQAPARLDTGKIYVIEASPQKEDTFRALVEPRMRALAQGEPHATVSGIFRVTAKNGNDVQFKPYVYVGNRLAYQQETRRYRGSIFVGVEALDPDSAEGGISEPVVFQALDAGVDPEVMRVDTVGPPFRAMAIEVPSVQDVVKFRLLAKNAGGELSIVVPVAPTIWVKATNTEMQGYGLGTMPINVSVAGIEKPEGRLVTFRASPRGTFDPAPVKLDAHGNASTTLRSDGIGVIEVSATTGDATTIADTVVFKMPVETASASVFGGLLGGLIRVLPTRRRGGNWSALVRLIVAVLIGLLGFALYAIGVNLTPIQPTVTQGAIVVFAMSGVFAYLGAKWLKGLELPSKG